MVRRRQCPFCGAANVVEDFVHAVVFCPGCGRPFTVADRANQRAIPFRTVPVTPPIAMPAVSSSTAIAGPTLLRDVGPVSVDRSRRRAGVWARVSTVLMLGMTLGWYAVRGNGRPRDDDSPRAALNAIRPAAATPTASPADGSHADLIKRVERPILRDGMVRYGVYGRQSAGRGTVIKTAIDTAPLTVIRVTTLRAAIMESNAHNGGHNLIRFDIGGYSPVKEGIYTVNSTGDESDSNPGDGIACVNGPLQGNCSHSVHTIRLHSALPALTQEVTIDGRSQPGYVGKPLIELDGSDAPGEGLVIDGGNTIITGLVIGAFSKAGILINSHDNTVAGCFIGTDSSGTQANGNGIGIEIDGADRNIIGGYAEDDRNIISGNVGDGVYVHGDSSFGQHIGNYVGLDVTGSKGIGNGGYGFRGE
jgi:hypothetical protein